jgi:hypothetical protein
MHHKMSLGWRLPLIAYLAVVLLVQAVSPVKAQGSKGLEGKYDISGVNPDGIAYTGTLVITPSSTETDRGQAYQLTWTIGKNSVPGLGLLHDGILSVAAGTPGCLLVVYKFDKNGLNGVWAGFNAKTFLPETVTPGSSSTMFSTKGSIHGTNPDGTKYTGTLTVDVFGIVSAWKWNTSGKSIQPGVGLIESSDAGEGFVATEQLGTNDKCTAVSYKVGTSDNLYGIWAVVGAKTIGSEIAIPHS